MKKTEVRSRWARMLSRCEDDDYPQYQNYGGRGIYVCDDWHDFHIFYRWCIENGLEPHLQVDRSDNDGPYSPENCTIVTRKQNARNKRNSLWVEAFGQRRTLAEWAENDICQVSYSTLQRRLKLGWQPEEALTRSTGDSRNLPAHNARTYEAFGEKKTLNQWSHDPRCVVGFKTLSHRVNVSDWKIERALTQDLGPQHGRSAL